MTRRAKEMKRSERAARILSIVEDNPGLTAREIAALEGITYRYAHYLLEDLIADGVVDFTSTYEYTRGTFEFFRCDVAIP